MATTKRTPAKRSTKTAAAKKPSKRAAAKPRSKKKTVAIDDVPETEMPDGWRETVEVIGVSELPQFLGFKRSTVHVWGYRKQLPPADQIINGFAAWKRETILRWAAETGRIREDQLPAAVFAEARQYEPEGGYKRKRRTKAEIAAARDEGEAA